MARATENGEWRAGTATTVITPTETMWMAGFGFREGPANGVERDLQAKALAIEDGEGNRVVLVSVELLAVQRSIRESVAEQCSSAYDLPPENLFINATHTHCGPEYRDYKIDMQSTDPEQHRSAAATYRTRLVRELVTIIGDALETVSPANIAYDHARCGFAMCRRRPKPEGIGHEPNPEGPVDHDVPVLTIRVEGEVSAIVFGYACHTTSVIRCDGWMRYHGDWAGFAQAFLEEQYPNATAMFIQGCAGDQNAYPRGSLGLATQHGQTIANAVEVAVEGSRTRLNGPIRTLYQEQPVAFEEPPSREELETRLNATDPVARVRARELLAELESTGSIRTVHPLPVQGIGFGNTLTMLGLGGEVLVEYGRRLKSATDGELWVAGYTNAGFTYVPTERALYRGGYEGGDVIQYTTFSGTPCHDVERRVLGRASAVIEKVSGP